MFTMENLQVIWWLIIGMLMVTYAATAGFDYGATMIMPFMRDEHQRRVVLNVVGRTWDGNQTWIVFFGGSLFVIWPAVYGSIFSGFYAAMLLILWSLFLRPPGFDYRSKIDSMVWRRCWDLGLLLSSVIPMFAFGLALGNIMQGVPISFDDFSLRSFYNGNFWGLLNGFAILCGLTSVAMGLMHAAVLLHRRTEGDLKQFFKKIHTIFTIIFLLLFIGAGFMVAFSVTGYHLVQSASLTSIHPYDSVVTTARGGWILSYGAEPWKAYPPVIAIFSFIIVPFLMRLGAPGAAFWASCMGVFGTVATFGAAMFPFVVPSSYNPNQSLTIYDASRGFYKMEILLYVAVGLFFVIVFYKVFAYFSVWHDKQTINVDDVKKNEHEFY